MKKFLTIFLFFGINNLIFADMIPLVALTAWFKCESKDNTMTCNVFQEPNLYSIDVQLEEVNTDNTKIGSLEEGRFEINEKKSFIDKAYYWGGSLRRTVYLDNQKEFFLSTSSQIGQTTSLGELAFSSTTSETKEGMKALTLTGPFIEVNRELYLPYIALAYGNQSFNAESFKKANIPQQFTFKK